MTNGGTSWSCPRKIAMNNRVDQLAGAVQTRDDFIRFVQALASDLALHADSWENSSLPTFLEALAGWAADMDGYFRNRG
jgi:hypothetical protein